MGAPIVRRRSDGLVQIRPRPAWRVVVGPVPAVLLALLAGIAVVVGGVMAAVLVAPLTTAVVGGCAALGVWAARRVHASGSGDLPAARPPPRDAA